MIRTAVLALLSFAAATNAATYDPVQLAAWESFFDATAGASWTKCSGKRDNPCDCSGTTAASVTCDVVNGVSFIKTVSFNKNNLKAASFPTDEVTSVIDTYDAFVSFKIANEAGLKNPGGACLDIPPCITGVTCSMNGFPVCAAGATPAPTKETTSSPTKVVTSSPSKAATKTPTVAPSKVGTGSPTKAVTGAPTPGSTTAWKMLFDQTKGTTWNKCTGKRNTPCDCSLVTCAGTVITVLSLSGNNLIDTAFPSAAVSQLILAGATTVDLSNNPKLAPGLTCVTVPECSLPGVTCTFSVPLCVTTDSPTIEEPTDAPTESPSAETTTPAPTPAVTVQPTAAPSPAGSTVTPTLATTGAPTTIAPTQAPVTAPPTKVGDTKTPTSQPTNLPSLSPAGKTVPPTKAPVAGVNTASPTVASGSRIPTQSPTAVGDTLAPTGSSANKFSPSFTIMAAVMVLGALFQ